MSIPWREFVTRLSDPPDNLSIIPNPLIDPDDESALEQSLLDLPSFASLYGATFIQPTTLWSERALSWTRTGPDNATISAWICRALIDGVFDAHIWIAALGDQGNARLGEVFLQWGQRDFQSCLAAFDRHYLPTNRIPILQQLLAIILSVPYSPDTPATSTHMYALASHPFLDTVIRSLLLDTANSLFPLGLRTILTVIPYAPIVLTTKVPLLMVILGRAVCWRDRPFVDAGKSSDSPATYTPLPRVAGWAVATSATELPLDPPISLQPANIVRLWLVAIYGAWPSNLLAFVRDPVTYLKGKQVECPYQVDWDQVWPSGLLAARTGPLLKEFSLHPSIMYFNSDGELKDAKRWDKIDPPEHVSRAHIIAHSERLSSNKADFFDQDTHSDFQSVQVSEAPTPLDPRSPTPVASDISRLQRENMLLRLEAGYADRLRKQYLFHIGRLHKHSMRFSVDEAEVHSFANRMKEQKSQILAVTSELSQHRRDATQAQQKHSKWQEQLREKLSTSREDRRNWQNEAASIRTNLNDLGSTVMRQKAELAQVKNERFKLQNQLTEVAPKVSHIEDFENRMDQMTKAQRLWDQDLQRLKDAEAQAAKWKARVYELETMLRAVHQAPKDVNAPPIVLEQNLPKPSTPPRPQPQSVSSDIHAPSLTRPDIVYYQSVAEKTQKRVNELERENLELRVKLDSKGRQAQSAGDGERGFLWAD